MLFIPRDLIDLVSWRTTDDQDQLRWPVISELVPLPGPDHNDISGTNGLDRVIHAQARSARSDEVNLVRDGVVMIPALGARRMRDHGQAVAGQAGAVPGQFLNVRAIRADENWDGAHSA